MLSQSFCPDCPDIIRTIIIYLSPYNLINFFEQFNISPNISFTYDAKSFPLSGYDILSILNNFPNITITSLYISDHITNKSLNLKKLTHCTIMGVIGNGNIGNSFVLYKYSTISSLRIFFASNSDLYILPQYQNLQKLTISQCVIAGYLFNYLTFCKNLHTFKLQSALMPIYDEAILALSKCHNLVRLELQCEIYSCETILSCKKLRYFKCIDTDNHSTKGLTMDIICECQNLRKLTFSSSHLYDISALIKCKKLRKLDLRGCTNIEDMTLVSTMIKDRKIEYYI